MRVVTVQMNKKKPNHAGDVYYITQLLLFDNRTPSISSILQSRSWILHAYSISRSMKKTRLQFHRLLRAEIIWSRERMKRTIHLRSDIRTDHETEEFTIRTFWKFFFPCVICIILHTTLIESFHAFDTFHTIRKKNSLPDSFFFQTWSQLQAYIRRSRE